MFDKDKFELFESYEPLAKEVETQRLKAEVKDICIQKGINYLQAFSFIRNHYKTGINEYDNESVYKKIERRRLAKEAVDMYSGKEKDLINAHVNKGVQEYEEEKLIFSFEY